VVPALAAGVLHAAGAREAVGGLMQQRAQHLQRASLEAFAADQDLMTVGAVDLPAVGGEVSSVAATRPNRTIAAKPPEHHP